jgi:hypothetical protein
MRIEVHIDRLVVDGGLGLERRHADALRATVVAELTSALATRPVWAPETVHTLEASAPLSCPVTPAAAGRAVAHSLLRGS